MWGTSSVPGQHELVMNLLMGILREYVCSILHFICIVYIYFDLSAYQ